MIHRARISNDSYSKYKRKKIRQKYLLRFFFFIVDFGRNLFFPTFKLLRSLTVPERVARGAKERSQLIPQLPNTKRSPTCFNTIFHLISKVFISFQKFFRFAAHFSIFFSFPSFFPFTASC